ncbi:MAG: alkaline phosphatase [Cellvibrio sp.]|uniref:alkaline phosphatase n=1 Tax=Cellvibrio sp. TaxID=1965322 RepID=UPI0031A195F9
MKRLTVTGLTLALALTGCGSDDNKSSSSRSSSSASSAAASSTPASSSAPAASSSTPAASSTPSSSSSSAAPVAKKNVLFFLGDGMGITTLTAMRIYEVGEAGSITIDTLPESAFVRTYSEDGQVTDSAPSMAAYMTGVKMKNEVISMTTGTNAYRADGSQFVDANGNSTCEAGNGQAVPTLLEQMKAKGYATGVVSTTRITHATPATTYSHVCNRNGENTIAAQMVPNGAGFNAALGNGIDVVLGGGLRHFLPSTVSGGRRTDSRNLVEEMKTAGYTYATNTSELLAAANTTNKLLGLFTSSDMSYELDRNPTAEPSLSEMTGKAIDILNQREKGFFLMVEGGRIDHALHASNAKRALTDGIAFDNAIKLALEKMEAVDPGLKNTLVVVTADHDHTLVINGYAERTGKTTDSHAGVLGLVKSYVNGPTKGQPTKDVDGNPYTILAFGNGPNRPATRIALDETTTSGKDYLQEAVIQLDSETHGGGDVFLGAKGMGAENFHGVIDNVEVFGLIKKAINLE